jgi:hypothetical protein
VWSGCAGFAKHWACRGKKTRRASERDTQAARQARLDYRAQLIGCAVERLKFVDESGVNIAMTRPGILGKT